VTHTHTLASALASSPWHCHSARDSVSDAANAPLRLALDNYEAAMPLRAALCGTVTDPMAPGIKPVLLAFGPERGWGPADRSVLRASNFTLCSLGPRVLRLETAVTAALSLVLYAGRETG
jgi:RsmE family RNA methyltransferase